MLWPFAPFCLVSIAGTLLLNRYGWRLSRVLFCLALVLTLNFAELEIVWHYMGERLPAIHSLVLVLTLSVSLLSPLVILMSLVGWISYRRGHNPIWGTCICQALYIGAYTWLVLWIRTPNTPDLTREQATEILQSRPEFLSQGHSPSISRIQRTHDSTGDFLCNGHLSFVRSNGERVDDGLVTFQVRKGHWTFESYRWGPPDKAFVMSVGIREPMPISLHPANIERPYPPDLSPKRLPNGSYVQYDPSAPTANSK